jgi:dihydroorotate dehydrogenase (NAD+) catalytic subunit
MVWQVKNAVGIPVLGMGGIAKAKDAFEMMLAGADLISVGTALLADPYAPVRITEGHRGYLEQQGIARAAELTGKVKPY